MINRIISHYKIIEKIGEGGMGIIYKALDIKLNRFIAIKLLPAHLTCIENEKQRFIHEAKAASTLDHNNICTIHEIDETEDGQLFISMAYYEGETLDKKIREKPLVLEDTIVIAIQIAQGLAKAHDKGIVHRDIKPANIMMTNEGVVKVLDFGLAKLSSQTKLTKESTTLGTVSYISPEQAKGEDVGLHTDIWSFGVIIFEMLTGQLPFKGDYESAVIYNILNDKQQPLTALRTGVPITLERIVNKALAKIAAERYQHVDEMIVDLLAVKKQIENVSIRNKYAETIATKGKSIKFNNFIIMLVILLLILAGIFYWQEEHYPVTSIAVLPFDNFIEDAEQDYFVASMTEKLITELSKIAVISVRPRRSSLHYKNTNKMAHEIADELNVGTLLTGSALLLDDRIRISVQLIEATTNRILWTEDYERDLVDILVLQNEIALAITDNIRILLSAPEELHLDKKHSAYLKADNP